MPFATRPGLGCDVMEGNEAAAPSSLPLAAAAPHRRAAPHVHAGLFASLTTKTGAAVAAAAAGGAAASRAAGPRQEPRTRTPFPADYCHLKKRDCPGLAGVGARSKRLLGLKSVDVYALGLYVDPAAVKRAAAGRKSVDASLLAAVASDAVPKTLVVRVTTGLLNRARFLSSVRETLAPALAKAGDPAAMDAFEALFAGTEMTKGTALAFSNVPGGGMAVRVGGKELGRITSKAFAPAFFNLYLGPEPVSADGKASIAAGLAALI